MDRTIVVADLHLHVHPGWRWKWCQDFVQYISEERGEANTLLLLGDVFECRDFLDSRVLNLFFEMVACWPRVVWVAGQHDSSSPGYCTLREMQSVHRNMTVVDEAVVQDIEDDAIFYVPFARNLERYRKMLSTVPDGAMVFTHMPVVEAIMELNPGEVDGISVREYDRFHEVWSGDIHHARDWPNGFHYLGAPSQRDWRDRGAKGYIGIWEDRKMKRASIDHPIHVEVDSLADLPKDGQLIVKLRSKERVSLEDFGGRVLSIAYTGTLDKLANSSADREIFNQEEPVEAVLGRYVESKGVAKKERKKMVEAGTGFFSSDAD